MNKWFSFEIAVKAMMSLLKRDIAVPWKQMKKYTNLCYFSLTDKFLVSSGS